MLSDDAISDADWYLQSGGMPEYVSWLWLCSRLQDVDPETGDLSLLTDDGEAKDDVTLSRAAAEGNDPTLPAGEGR